MDRIVLAKEGKKGKISIVGNIGWDYFGISYRAFKAQLADLGDVTDIEVDITSPGGVVTDGVAIMNALTSHPAKVTTIINGQAASIASVVAMAGDDIQMFDNSLMFVHKPLRALIGNADDMKKSAEDLDKFEKAMVNAYKRHFKGTDDEMKSLMRAETWLTADEVAEKFNNVKIIESGESKVAAHGDPVSLFGNPEDYTEDMLAFDDKGGHDEDFEEKFMGFLTKAFAKFRKQEPKATPKQEENMPLSKEEKAELVSEITASVVAALKPASEPAPAPKAQEPQAVELAFTGDMDKPEDVLAHAEALKKAQIKASVNWNDHESVLAYHKAIAPVAAAVPAKGSNTEPAKAPVVASAPAGMTKEQIQAEVDAVNAHRGFNK